MRLFLLPHRIHRSCFLEKGGNLKNISLNDIPHQTDSDNYQTLIETLPVDSQTTILLLNGDVLKKENYRITHINSGDKIDLISFVGGG
ncbi:MAG TPA: thiamine biosynthesis protein ThiS [Spirochaetia bacterium]|nr:thiamine biosynthesis protein ThiS [Spirochaetia bacterium]HBI38505.1 thiamine biosynthesis protein ThiS [Spirochaetia bacterium]